MGMDPLPPPPRPKLVKAFHYACAIVLAEMEQGEDDSGKHDPKVLARKHKDFVPT
jgi:hypothetical protein